MPKIPSAQLSSAEISKKLPDDVKAKVDIQVKKAMSWIDHQPERRIKSCGTHRSVQQALQSYARWIAYNRLGNLQRSTPRSAESFLVERSSLVTQKTLDQLRQAIEIYQHVSGRLPEDQHLTIITSHVETRLEHRAYTAEQVAAVATRQTERNALATELAFNAGLRAHELITIRPIGEQPPDKRDAEGKPRLGTKFNGREGVLYTVVGKGGLCREVLLRKDLADRLEAHRRPEPVEVRDRGVIYQSHYDIGYGNAFSRSFTDASKRALGWSTGAHGLRHSYVQERMKELRSHCDYETSLSTVSQEVGHFRSDITLIYQR
ncbi:hypothetical protein [Sutterella sp.]|uniref:hypothetical protein n=1 Tax=Sutterella sp. TaxID=1981025 RepID=UPI0026DEC2F8|nr:hypothetical protein [Sutterella sp.]MDO5532273.1 hypothetical protein [Sutterella sp.]